MRALAREVKICVIGGRALVSVMRFAGAELYYEVYDVASARKALEEVLERSDVGIVVVEERYRSAVADLLEKVRGRLTPIVVFLPGITEVAGYDARKVYKDLHRRTIGFEVEI